MQNQRGTILIIFLGWLAVLSVIGIGALRQSVGMAQTTQAQHLALQTFEAAQASLVAAQRVLGDWHHDPPTLCGEVCVVPAQEVDFYARQPNSWWQAQGNAAVMQIPWLDAIQAYYVIEYVTTQPAGSDRSEQVFRVTSKALAAHNAASTVLQLTVTKPLDTSRNRAQQQKVTAELTTLNDDATPIIREAWRQYY